jgi:hypothetical protein
MFYQGIVASSMMEHCRYILDLEIPKQQMSPSIEALALGGRGTRRPKNLGAINRNPTTTTVNVGIRQVFEGDKNCHKIVVAYQDTRFAQESTEQISQSLP